MRWRRTSPCIRHSFPRPTSHRSPSMSSRRPTGTGRARRFSLAVANFARQPDGAPHGHSWGGRAVRPIDRDPRRRQPPGSAGGSAPRVTRASARTSPPLTTHSTSTTMRSPGCGRHSRSGGGRGRVEPDAGAARARPDRSGLDGGPRRLRPGKGRRLDLRPLAPGRRAGTTGPDPRSTGLPLAGRSRRAGGATGVAAPDAASGSRRRRYDLRQGGTLACRGAAVAARRLRCPTRTHRSSASRMARRAATSYSAFSAQEASFASAPAFPILVGNAVDWLGRPEHGAHRQPGRISLPAATRRIVAPNGQPVPLVTIGDRVSATLPAPGLYLAETASGQRVLAVGLDDPARSNLLSSTVAENRATRAARRGRSSRGGSTAAAAFVLAGAEWVTWRRRITV